MVNRSLNHEFLRNHQFLSELGITIEEESTGSVTLTLPHEDRLTNPGNAVIQGGILATLVDHAGGAALRTTFDSRPAPFHATTDLSVSYLRPPTSSLTATGTVLRTGGTMGVVRVTIVNVENELVAEGRVSLAIRREQSMPGID